MDIFTLTNAHDMMVRIIPYGGRIISLHIPDRNGVQRDVVLGFDMAEEYLRENHLTDFGAAIGRYANRIGNGLVSVGGRTIQLPQNNGPHTLHGGPDGWQYKMYEMVQYSHNRLELKLVSPDGDNGFPGKMEVRLTYTLGEDNTLGISYHATTDAPTVINMTNHSYFNLNGDGNSSIFNHLLTIDADRYTPIDNTFLPIGIIGQVDDSPFDFRQPKAVGLEIDSGHIQLIYGNGYDHNWALNTCGDITRPCARLESPLTGIGMEVFTTEPGMQVYTGNFLDGSIIGKGGKAYAKHNAICLETQKYPDSPNNSWTESNAFLNPGEDFDSETRWRFYHR